MVISGTNWLEVPYLPFIEGLCFWGKGRSPKTWPEMIIPSGNLLLLNMAIEIFAAIEYGHRNSGYIQWTCWFSIVMLVYRRVYMGNCPLHPWILRGYWISQARLKTKGVWVKGLFWGLMMLANRPRAWKIWKSCCSYDDGVVSQMVNPRWIPK